MKKMLAAALSLISLSGAAADYSVPREFWGFMEGYKYEYPNCAVAWSGRTATFLPYGNGCSDISSEKMKADALKSIDYVKKNSNASNFLDYYTLVEQANKLHGVKEANEQANRPYGIDDANRDAQTIWVSGCSDFKNGLNEGDFPKWLKLEPNVNKYPRIKRAPVINLYMDGWNMARTTNGVINCDELAPYRAKDYVSGVDIRSGQ